MDFLTGKGEDFKIISSQKTTTDKDEEEMLPEKKTLGPLRPKFVVSSVPKEAEKVNPEIIYRTLDNEENSMIKGNIFEIKKTIMAEPKNTSLSDQETKMSESVEEAAVDEIVDPEKYRLLDRFYFKMRKIIEGQ